MKYRETMCPLSRLQLFIDCDEKKPPPMPDAVSILVAGVPRLVQLEHVSVRLPTADYALGIDGDVSNRSVAERKGTVDELRRNLFSTVRERQRQLYSFDRMRDEFKHPFIALQPCYGDFVRYSDDGITGLNVLDRLYEEAYKRRIDVHFMPSGHSFGALLCRQLLHWYIQAGAMPL